MRNEKTEPCCAILDSKLEIMISLQSWTVHTIWTINLYKTETLIVMWGRTCRRRRDVRRATERAARAQEEDTTRDRQ
jgi:hypothetical protein